MKTIRKVASICVKDLNNIEYCFCKIEHYLSEDSTFKYVFTPNYSVISLMDSSFFQGIPGINLDIRKTEYIRENITPVFISERVPNEKREDLYELLNEVSMDYLDPLEYLIRTKMFYSGDNYYLRPFVEKQTFHFDFDNSKNNLSSIVNIIITNIASGNDVELPDITINDTNRRDIFKTLLSLYKKSLNYKAFKQKQGINDAKLQGKYKGRKPIKVDMITFNRYLNKVKNKELTPKQAAKEMNISIDKYYRIKKKL